MSAHTPGPWYVVEHSWSDCSIGAPNFDHGICSLDINHATEESQAADEAQMLANARRIVACVNACEGVPIEVLETQKAGGLPWRVADQIDKLAERNELLEALRDFMLAAACKNAKASQFRARFAQAERKGRAAIAKATGVAS